MRHEVISFFQLLHKMALLLFYQVKDTLNIHCKKQICKIYGKKLAAVVAGILP